VIDQDADLNTTDESESTPLMLYGDHEHPLIDKLTKRNIKWLQFKLCLEMLLSACVISTTLACAALLINSSATLSTGLIGTLSALSFGLKTLIFQTFAITPTILFATAVLLFLIAIIYSISVEAAEVARSKWGKILRSIAVITTASVVFGIAGLGLGSLPVLLNYISLPITYSITALLGLIIGTVVSWAISFRQVEPSAQANPISKNSSLNADNTTNPLFSPAKAPAAGGAALPAASPRMSLGGHGEADEADLADDGSSPPLLLLRDKPLLKPSPIEQRALKGRHHGLKCPLNQLIHALIADIQWRHPV
jgi:hypothetical protein